MARCIDDSKNMSKKPPSYDNSITLLRLFEWDLNLLKIPPSASSSSPIWSESAFGPNPAPSAWIYCPHWNHSHTVCCETPGYSCCESIYLTNSTQNTGSRPCCALQPAHPTKLPCRAFYCLR